jgi:hypothetical protein
MRQLYTIKTKKHKKEYLPSSVDPPTQTSFHLQIIHYQTQKMDPMNNTNP